MKEIKKGIVLRVTEYLGNAKILELYTKEGLISVYVSDGKTNRSTKKAFSQIFTEVSCEITDSSKMPKLIEGEILNSYSNVKDDFEKINIMAQLCNILYYFSKSEMNHDKVFDLYEKAFSYLDKMEYSKEIYLVTLEKTLFYLGVSPQLGKALEESFHISDFVISLENGGFISCEAISEGDTSLSDKVALIFTEYFYCKYENISKIISIQDFHKIESFLIKYYSKYIGYKLKPLS